MEDCCGALRPCDTFAPRDLQRGRAARQGGAPREREAREAGRCPPLWSRL